MFWRTLLRCSLALPLPLLLFPTASGQTRPNLDSRYIQPAQQAPNLGAITPTVATGGRTIKFVNSCPFAVWLGDVGGIAKPCATNSDCATGTTCGTDKYCSCAKDADCGVNRACAANNRCYWVMPQPKSGWWVLLPKGQKFFTFASTATFELQDSGTAQRWNGKFYPRTGCQFSSKGFVCDTGSCIDKKGNYQVLCNDPDVGQVGAGPYTLIEFNLWNSNAGDPTNIDFYDISLIHGMNVPADIKPDPAGSYPAGTGENAMYWCGTAAGNPASSGQLTACTYKFTPATMDYLAVTGGGKLCATDTSCTTAGQKCGLAMQSVMEPKTTTNWGKLTCGAPIAWWTPTAICGNNSTFGSPNTTLLNCTQPVDAQYGAYGTLSSMYQCSVGGTCYADGAPNTCCGCKKWGYPAFPNCQNSNDKWTAEVLPKIQFIKDACPTAYSYQFDDKSGTFDCKTTSAPNTTNYIVTLCPGGNTGLPSTATPR